MSDHTARLEYDLPGVTTPADAYYSVRAARGLESLDISVVRLRLHPDLIKALAMVKLATARAHAECGTIGAETVMGIEGACHEIIAGMHHDQFQFDVFFGSAGTSTNMNANEAIANRAFELIGRRKGEYQDCDPQDYVNASLSTSDVYSTALHVGMALGNVRLLAATNKLIASFPPDRAVVWPMLNRGRPRFQDSVPMTPGQKFTAFDERLAGEVRALEAVQRVLCGINIGATAIRTGLNAPAGYAQKYTAHLAAVSRLPLYIATDLIGATRDTQALVLYSCCMKSLAIKLARVCNDLRLLSADPRCGRSEINLPPKRPDSSIMPGKVNRVLPEAVNIVGFRVVGNDDQIITMPAEAGQPQLNVFQPAIAPCIFEAQTMLVNAANTIRVRCVGGIRANPDVYGHFVDYDVGTPS